VRECITKRKNSWAIVIDAEKNPKIGRRKQKWKNGFATCKEAEANALVEMGRKGEYTVFKPLKCHLYLHMIGARQRKTLQDLLSCQRF